MMADLLVQVCCSLAAAPVPRVDLELGFRTVVKW